MTSSEGYPSDAASGSTGGTGVRTFLPLQFLGASDRPAHPPESLYPDFEENVGQQSGRQQFFELGFTEESDAKLFCPIEL
jgi:hypothetical protein